MAVFRKISILCAVLLLIGQAEPQRTGGIVAIVGDTVITQSDLDMRVTHRWSQSPPEYPQRLLDWHRLRYERRELERLIEEKLVLHRVQNIEKKDGRPYITEEHIDAEVARRVQKHNDEGNTAYTVEDFYRSFRELGLDRKRTRSFLREQMSIVKFLWQEVYPRVKTWVSPEEARYYYRTHIDEFTTPVKIWLRQVFIPKSRRDAQMATAAMEKGLREGEDFVELARLFAQEVLGEEQAAQAGRVREYSFEDISEWHPPLPETLRQMKPGQVAGPVQTAIGFHFLKVEDVISGAPEPFSEAHPDIHKRVLAQRKAVAQRRFLEEARLSIRIQIYLPPLPDEGSEAGTHGERDGGVNGPRRAAPRSEKAGGQ